MNDLIDTDHREIVTIIVWRGVRSAADNRRITEWLDEHHPAWSSEVHHGGQSLFPYLFCILWSPGLHHLPAAAGRNRGRPPAGVGPKHADAIEVSGSPRASTWSPTIRAATSTGPTRWRSPTRRRGGSSGPGEVRRSTARRTRQGRSIVEIELFDGTSYLALILQSALAGQAAPEATEVVVFGKVERFRGRPQMTNPVVDLVGDRGPDRARLPAIGEGRPHHLGDPRLGGGGHSPGPDPSAIRYPSVAKELEPPRARLGRAPEPGARLDGGSQRPAGGWPSTSSSASK